MYANGELSEHNSTVTQEKFESITEFRKKKRISLLRPVFTLILKRTKIPPYKQHLPDLSFQVKSHNGDASCRYLPQTTRPDCCPILI